MTDCERCWIPFSQKIQCKTLTNVLWFGNVYVFDIGSICVHGKELLRQFAFHQKYRGKSHFKADVRNIWTVDIGTIGWDFWSVSNQLGKFSMETVISGQWWRSHQSLACKGSRILRFCVMSWKDESEPNIKYCLGTTVGMVQRFITIPNIGHNQRRTDGIRVEYFPGFTTLELVREVQKLMSKMGEPEQFQGRIIFMSMFNDIIWEIKTMRRNVLLIPHLCLYSQKISSRTLVIPRTWIRNKVVFYLHWQTKRRMGSSRWIDDDQIWRKRTPSFPSHESVVPGNAQKQRRWKIIHFCADGDTIETVFRAIISVNQLSIYGASVKQSTGRPVEAEQSDPFVEPADLLIMTPTSSIEIPAQENLL